jgi:hypothetical protein
LEQEETKTMPHSLEFVFEGTTTKGQSYWWPIICDVLAEYRFQFADPDEAERKSEYLYTRQEETTEILLGPFRDFWNEICAGVEVMTGTFWYQEEKVGAIPLSVEVTAGWKPELSAFHFSLSMPGANVMAEPRETVKQILKLVLACAKRLYEVCLPDSGVSYWTTPGPNTTPWAVFGKILSQPFDLGYPSEKPEQQVVTQPLANGKQLSFFDPVPYPYIDKDAHAGGWTSISLLHQSGLFEP